MLRTQRLERMEALKFLQFLDYFRGKKGWSVELLDREVLVEELKFYKSDSGGLPIYDRLRYYLQPMTLPRAFGDVRQPHGMLLYGPPGTGKTFIAKQLLSLGFVSLNEPLAAAEISGGLVGDSEGMLRALFERGARLPWLPCCLILDEMDNIAPNRLGAKEGGSETKQSVLTTLLTIFGGARDQPNVFLIGTTNVKSNMDPAFLRRMHIKAFVGLPSGKTRKDFVKKFLRLRETTLVLDEIGRMTTNFSVDNLKTLTSNVEASLYEEYSQRADAVITDWKSQVLPTLSNSMGIERWREAVLSVCRSETIFFGNHFIPDLLQQSLLTAQLNLKQFLEGAPLQHLSGKMFVDIRGVHAPSNEGKRIDQLSLLRF
ncbi:P-loop containing nucleoside triphosphate hydrolase protein [Gonapodya prolifera JEL478]|uniref:p-loop containing nucleoside triphosphate hydrolase protein n=1 Tax=Gonapodya prolifera (strain JEL478) TaxID=1344416 RepID=A0A139A2M1_GONPJ|nr:P-loop containing nucleoside triphosphate hydrolase protein [Gonapodya prolifera JEL478]|eukprot:KXS11012.1 P-loop containing nucleoside triphosphate hydrolase protein [Gonapodya prolifera JEL478]